MDIPQSQPDDLDFAEDLALLSHTQQHMQEKTSTVVADNSACSNSPKYP